MAWPTITGTGNLDNNVGSPIFARADILKHVQDTNSIITEFDDVDLTGASDKQLLAWDGSKWGVSDTTLAQAAHMRHNLGTAFTSWSTTTGSFSATHDFEWNNTGYVDPNQYIHPSSPVTELINPDIIAGTYAIKINGFVGIRITRIAGGPPAPYDGLITGMDFTVKLVDTDTSTTIVSMTPQDTGSYDIDLAEGDPGGSQTNDHQEVVYIAMAAEHTFSSTTNIKLQATLSWTTGNSPSTPDGDDDGSGYYHIRGGLLSRFIKT